MRPFAAAAATSDDAGGPMNASWGKDPEHNFDIKVVFVSAPGANHTPRYAGLYFFLELTMMYLIGLQAEVNYGLWAAKSLNSCTLANFSVFWESFQ